MNIQEIDINKLYISKLNVRKISEDDESITELSLNISKNGLLNPLTVKLNNTNNKYEILAGQRRYQALKKLSYVNIQCNVLNENMPEKEQIIISLTENIHRTQMKLSDKVKAYKQLHILLEEDIDAVAKSMNVHITTIRKYLKITHLPDIILDKLDAKSTEKISLDFACKLGDLNIFDETKLLSIMDIFEDVEVGSKIGLIKKMMNQTKYKNNEFENYIIKLKEIKVEHHIEKSIEKKIIAEQKKERDEILKKELEDLKKLNNDNNKIDNDQSNIIKEIKEVKPKIKTDEHYKNKISELVKEQSLYICCDVRNPLLQNVFREGLINRFNKCIISDLHFDVCEACHIIPFSESNSFDIDNGLLLNCILHKLFDNYEFSIDSDLLVVEISNKSNNYDYLKIFDKKYINSLEKYKKTRDLLKEHYGIFKEKTKLDKKYTL